MGGKEGLDSNIRQNLCVLVTHSLGENELTMISSFPTGTMECHSWRLGKRVKTALDRKVRGLRQ